MYISCRRSPVILNFTISKDEKYTLLADARESIAAKLEERPPRYKRGEEIAAAISQGCSVLSLPCGAFVSLHNITKGRQLRGCIGRMNASETLEKTIRTMAKEAAFGDPRFPPLSKEEFACCQIEISVLSPMEKCSDPHSVEVGIHGLYLTKHGRSGVLLPQVPVEQGWNLNEYLDYICVKAGLPPKSYEDPHAELRTFTAVVFSEEI